MNRWALYLKMIQKEIKIENHKGGAVSKPEQSFWHGDTRGECKYWATTTWPQSHTSLFTNLQCSRLCKWLPIYGLRTKPASLPISNQIGSLLHRMVVSLLLAQTRIWPQKMQKRKKQLNWIEYILNTHISFVNDKYWLLKEISKIFFSP